MEEARKNFLDYLEDKNSTMQEIIARNVEKKKFFKINDKSYSFHTLVNAQKKAEALIRFIKTPEEKQPYKDYKRLVYYLEVSPFDNAKKMQTLFYVIEKNAFLLATDSSDNEFKKAHQRIKIHYFGKLDSYTANDIREIRSALKSLEIEEEFQLEVVKSLIKSTKKRSNLQKPDKEEFSFYEEELLAEDAIKKFKLYLKTKIKKIEEEINNIYNIEVWKQSTLNEEIKTDIQNRINKEYEHEIIIKNVAKETEKMFETPDYTTETCIFGDYSFFCELLEKSELKVQEKLYIVIAFLKKALLNFDANSLIVSPEEVEFARPAKLNQDEHKIYVYLEPQGFSEKWKKLIKDKEGEDQQQIKLLRFLKQEQIDAVLEFKKEFYQKNYSPQKDIHTFIYNLRILGITPELCQAFEHLLTKKVSKTQIRETSIISSNRKKQSVMSGKEYNKIFKEIMSMYDIQEHRVVTPLTHEKIVYLVSLMLQINIPEVEIKRCIQDINWHGIEAYTNPIEAFNDYYGKLVNNSHYGEVELVIQNIKEYINLSFLPENDIEYNGWKGEIAEELRKVRNLINQDDTYELEEGKKLYRSKIDAKTNEED